jgi:hypothetical protein
MPSAARKKPQTVPKMTAPPKEAPPRGPIRIYVNAMDHQSVFGLDYRWWNELRRRGIEPARTVSIRADREQDYEKIDGRVWRQVALILTGLTESMLADEGVVLCDPDTDKVIARVF